MNTNERTKLAIEARWQMGRTLSRTDIPSGGLLVMAERLGVPLNWLSETMAVYEAFPDKVPAYDTWYNSAITWWQLTQVARLRTAKAREHAIIRLCSSPMEPSDLLKYVEKHNSPVNPEGETT